MPDTGYQGKIQSLSDEEEYSDYFKDGKYNLHWQWNANYDKGWYDITNEGLKLYAVPKEDDRALSDVSNILLKKWFAPEFVSEIAMDFDGLTEGDIAGVMSLGIDYGALVVEKQNGRLIIKSVTGGQKYSGFNVSTVENEMVLGSVTSDKLVFRYEVMAKPEDTVKYDGITRPQETIKISYSENGVNFTDGCEFKAKAGRWVGVKYGVFCCGKSEESQGYAIVNYLKNK